MKKINTSFYRMVEIQMIYINEFVVFFAEDIFEDSNDFTVIFDEFNYFNLYFTI